MSEEDDSTRLIKQKDQILTEIEVIVDKSQYNSISEIRNEVKEETENNDTENREKLEKEEEVSSNGNNNSCSCDQYLKKVKELEERCFRLDETNNDLENKLKIAIQKYENLNKEKESMVIRYAVNERAVLEQKAITEKVEKHLKEIMRENEILQHKVSMMCSEKNRICQILDNKCHELKTSQQELESTKSDFSILETKLKWCQNNLKSQIELNKEREENIENLNKKLQNATNQIEKAKADAEEYIKAFRYSQNNEAYVLGKQVQELQAQLILLKHEKGEKESQVQSLQSDLQEMKRKESELLKENNDLSVKVQDMQKELTSLEEKFRELKDSSDQQKQVSGELASKNIEIEQLKCVLKIKDEQIEDMNVQLSNLKQRNIDLELDIKSCKEREAEMLNFTKQLTDKNVELQSEFTSMDTKIERLTCEQNILKKSAREFETKSISLMEQLAQERKKYLEDVNSLKANLAELTKKCDQLSQEVAYHKGENVVIKRKYETSLREVNRELQQCRKKLEQNENLSSCTSSSSSTVSVGDVSNTSSSPTTEQVKVIQPEMVIEKQTLIDHIVKLQRVSARKSEKIDFLEEHINTLVEELQKKSRLLQNYMLNDHSGALSSNTMDKNKAYIAKTHGVMASMYGSRVADNNLTLELSLDINRKLQAVLEDALLKNITLKENVDTLGAEIERLNKLLQPSL